MSSIFEPSSNLSEAIPISTDMKIIFRGGGLARFRLLHGANAADGTPDIQTGVEVSAMSDARLRDPRGALGDDGVTVVGGVLIDFVEGNTEYRYRRHIATWLTVTPFDDPWDRTDDCAAGRYLDYTIDFEPLL